MPNVIKRNSLSNLTKEILFQKGALEPREIENQIGMMTFILPPKQRPKNNKDLKQKTCITINNLKTCHKAPSIRQWGKKLIRTDLPYVCLIRYLYLKCDISCNEIIKILYTLPQFEDFKEQIPEKVFTSIDRISKGFIEIPYFNDKNLFKHVAISTSKRKYIINILFKHGFNTSKSIAKFLRYSGLDENNFQEIDRKINKMIKDMTIKGQSFFLYKENYYPMSEDGKKINYIDEEMDINEVIIRAQNGDEIAYKAIFEKYYIFCKVHTTRVWNAENAIFNFPSYITSDDLTTYLYEYIPRIIEKYNFYKGALFDSYFIGQLRFRTKHWKSRFLRTKFNNTRKIKTKNGKLIKILVQEKYINPEIEDESTIFKYHEPRFEKIENETTKTIDNIKLLRKKLKKSQDIEIFDLILDQYDKHDTFKIKNNIPQINLTYFSKIMNLNRRTVQRRVKNLFNKLSIFLTSNL